MGLVAAIFLLAFSGGVGPAEKCQELYSAADHRSWAKQWIGSSNLPKKAKKRHMKYLQCAKGPNHRRSMRKMWKKVRSSSLPKRHDLWIRIARCEQPGRGYKGVNWSHPGPIYQGGLGFWYGTWDSYKYRGMPGNAGQATWREQMKVANRLFRQYGTSPWGCA